MPLPKVDLTGQRATITMMELRANPGEVIDSVRHGLAIDIEKNGKRVAVLARSDVSSDTTVIHRDGSTSPGPIPVYIPQKYGMWGLWRIDWKFLTKRL